MKRPGVQTHILPRALLVCTLVALLEACFQAQLYGPVSGVHITVADLRNPDVVHGQLTATSMDTNIAAYGQVVWDGFAPALKLWLLGVFQFDAQSLDDKKLYLVTARGGRDTDTNLDLAADASYTAVAGSWHAIMSGAELKLAGPKVSPLTEAAWQWLQTDIAALSDAQLHYNLDRAAKAMVVDVNADGLVDALDILSWSRLFDNDKLLVNLATLNQLTQALLENGEAVRRLAWSRQLVGLEVATGTLPAAAALADTLAGLSLEALFSESWRALLLREPEAVVQLGLSEEYGLTEPGLDNISDEYQRETAAMAAVVLRALLDIDRDSLLDDEQISWDIYRWYLEDVVAGSEFQLFSYPASGFITGVPRQTLFFFTDVHPLLVAQDARDYVARLEAVSHKFAQLREKVASRAQAGIIEPAITLEVAINAVRGVADSGVWGSPYYGRFSADASFIQDISAAERTALRERARAIIGDSILPAYQVLLSDLEALRPRAPDAIGVGQFEGGQQFYKWALRHHTGTQVSAAQVHQAGHENLVRVHVDIRRLASTLGYAVDLDLPSLFARLATDGGVLRGADILATYESIIATAQQKLPQAFNLLPKSEVVVIGDPFGGFYLPGSADGSRPGAFYAGNQGTEAYYQMPSLAYHEALPGHHLQIALAGELDLPDFQRHITYTGFTEGWALYAERLAAELGWYQADPFGDLGRLQFEAIRAARLAVDTGIHHLGWSWEEAVEFFRTNTGVSRGSAEGSVARFMRWPGQATAYMTGMNKILELRAARQTSQGAAFDLRAFHDRVLSSGSMPLSLLEQYLAVPDQAFDARL